MGQGSIFLIGVRSRSALNAYVEEGQCRTRIVVVILLVEGRHGGGGGGGGRMETGERRAGAKVWNVGSGRREGGS